MINVLYVLTKPELGGAQLHVLHLLHGLDKSQFGVFCFTAREGILAEKFVSIPGVKTHFSAFLDRNISLLKDFFTLFELIKFIKDHKIHIVHTHSSKAGVLGRCAAKMAGVQVVLHSVHGWSFHRGQVRWAYHFCVGLERLLARWTHRLFTVCHYDEKLGQALGISPQLGYECIRCGIQVVDYEKAMQHRSLAREEFRISATDLVVGTISCFKAQKNPQAFIRLAAYLKSKGLKVKCVLVGDGGLRSVLASMVKQLDLEDTVIFAGWREDVSRLLAVFDLFVLTSVWEGMPVAVLEAMAAGVPVVATNTGGVAEVLISGETGDLVAIGDDLMLFSKVTDLLMDVEKRKRYAKAAHLIVSQQEFDLKTTMRKMQNSYNEIFSRLVNG